MKKILILEDKEENRNSLIKIIQSMETEIEIYETGETSKAYQIALERNIDIFLIDIILEPEKADDTSGLVFADRMRQIEKYKFTPIIFLTALEDPELHAYKELHCYGYLTKPYKPEQLTRLVEEALNFEQQKEEVCGTGFGTQRQHSS